MKDYSLEHLSQNIHGHPPNPKCKISCLAFDEEKESFICFIMYGTPLWVQVLAPNPWAGGKED